MIWVQDKVAEPINVKKLAEHCRMNSRNFAHLFSQQVGCTLSKFFENKRLQAANS
jgi:transcriptional regulator GlxA family with amidase domain